MAESPAPGRSPLKLGAQVGAVALVAGLLGLLIWKIATREHATAAIEKPAPLFTLSRLDRPGTLSLASLRGKGVVLNFWASWCNPCKQETPMLEAASRRWGSRGLIVIGIDGSDDFKGDARAFMRKYGMTYPTVRDRQFSTVTHYGVGGYPETFFVNRRGKLVRHVAGPVDAEDLKSGITEALQ